MGTKCWPFGPGSSTVAVDGAELSISKARAWLRRSEVDLYTRTTLRSAFLNEFSAS